MLRIVAILILLAAPSVAGTVVVTIPLAAETESALRCEDLRASIPQDPATWSDEICHSEFLRRAHIVYDNAITQAASQKTVQDDRESAINKLRRDWQTAVVASFCGDSVTDTFLGETCDDGNNADGDGCSSDCLIE